MVITLKSLFLLDPDIIFLNHGSFGACPIPVFQVYQDWQRRLERQPVRFLGREHQDLMHQARQSLSHYLNVNSDDLVFVPNATHGVNIVARSLALGSGDEILTTDHEYGACNNAFDFLCQKTGAAYIRQPIHLPVQSHEDILEQFWQGVTPRTRLIFISHITSPTALRLPVETICARARQAGILTLIDGAHAPGQIDLDLPAVDSDFYTGNCHKWMLAPKGAAFLYARPEAQALVEPLIVSWGYSATPATTTGSRFVDLLEWTGTRDPAAYLAVPTALQFMQEHDWETVRQASEEILAYTLTRLAYLTEQPMLYPSHQGFYGQLGSAEMPPDTDLAALKIRLYNQYHIEIPTIEWNGRKFLRISVQGYNTPADLDALINSIQEILADKHSAAN